MSEQKKFLFHRWGEPLEDFLKRIDEFGGWPYNAKSVVLKHNDERSCYFSISEDVRNEYNTSICTSDDYYWWKLSQKRKDKHEQEIRYKIGMSILK